MSESLLGDATRRPKCISIVICNEIIGDKVTNNKTLVSLFNAIIVPSVPAAHPRFCIMISLTGGAGEWTTELCIYAPSGKELFRFNVKINFTNPADVIDLPLQVIGFPLLEMGVYRIDVLIGGRASADRTFSTIRTTQPGEPT